MKGPGSAPLGPAARGARARGGGQRKEERTIYNNNGEFDPGSG